jgi:hypothetical protein
MNSLTDLRRTLDQHAEDVADPADPAAVARTAAVHHRVAVVRRRRRAVGTGAVALALVVGVAAVVWPRGSGDALPAAPVVLGQQAPTSMSSLGYTYRTDGHGEAFGRTGSVTVARSDQPRLFSWTTDGASPVRITLPDGDVVHSTEGSFRDFVVVSPGERGRLTVHVDHGRVGLASYALTDAAPVGYTRHGVTFRQTVAGRPLLAAAISDPGQTVITGSYVVPNGPVQEHVFCSGLAKGQTLHLSVDGEDRDWLGRDNCDAEGTFDPGAGSFGQFPSHRPGTPVTVRLYVTAGVKDQRVLPASQVTALRMGFGMYGPVSEKPVGGWRVETTLEENGHTWALATTRSSAGAPIVVPAADRDRVASVVWNTTSNTTGVSFRAGSSRTGGERFAGGGQGGLPGLWAPAGSDVHLRLSQGKGVLGVALYERSD